MSAPARDGVPGGADVTAGSGSAIARRTVTTWITLIATLVCVFAARALVARELGPAGIGLYALMLTAAWLGGTILSLGSAGLQCQFRGPAARRRAPVELHRLERRRARPAGRRLRSRPRRHLLPLTWKRDDPRRLVSPLTALLECTRGIFQGMSAMTPYNWLGLTGGALNLAGVGALASTSRLTLRAACLLDRVDAVSAIAAVGRARRMAHGWRRSIGGCCSAA